MEHLEHEVGREEDEDRGGLSEGAAGMVVPDTKQHADAATSFRRSTDIITAWCYRKHADVETS